MAKNNIINISDIKREVNNNSIRIAPIMHGKTPWGDLWLWQYGTGLLFDAIDNQRETFWSMQDYPKRHNKNVQSLAALLQAIESFLFDIINLSGTREGSLWASSLNGVTRSRLLSQVRPYYKSWSELFCRQYENDGSMPYSSDDLCKLNIPHNIADIFADLSAGDFVNFVSEKAPKVFFDIFGYDPIDEIFSESLIEETYKCFFDEFTTAVAIGVWENASMEIASNLVEQLWDEHIAQHKELQVLTVSDDMFDWKNNVSKFKKRKRHGPSKRNQNS